MIWLRAEVVKRLRYSDNMTRQQLTEQLVETLARV